MYGVPYPTGVPKVLGNAFAKSAVLPTAEADNTNRTGGGITHIIHPNQNHDHSNTLGNRLPSSPIQSAGGGGQGLGYFCAQAGILHQRQAQSVESHSIWFSAFSNTCQLLQPSNGKYTTGLLMLAKRPPSTTSPSAATR